MGRVKAEKIRITPECVVRTDEGVILTREILDDYVEQLRKQGRREDSVRNSETIFQQFFDVLPQSKVITIIVAAYMIIFPVIRIILAKSNWSEQLKREALRIVLGVLLMVFGGTILGTAGAILNTLLWVLGAVIMALAAIFGLVDIIRLATKK